MLRRCRRERWDTLLGSCGPWGGSLTGTPERLHGRREGQRVHEERGKRKGRRGRGKRMKRRRYSGTSELGPVIVSLVGRSPKCISSGTLRVEAVPFSEVPR